MALTETQRQAIDLECSLIEVQRAARQHMFSSEVMRLHFGRMAQHTRTPEYPDGLRKAVTKDYATYCRARINAKKAGANVSQIDDAIRAGITEGEADAKSLTASEARSFAAMFEDDPASCPWLAYHTEDMDPDDAYHACRNFYGF